MKIYIYRVEPSTLIQPCLVPTRVTRLAEDWRYMYMYGFEGN